MLRLTRAIHKCASLNTLIPASAALFIAEQETRSPTEEKYPRRRGVAFPVGGLARHGPGGRPGRHALQGEDLLQRRCPGPCLTAAVCARRLRLDDRHDGGATA